MLSNQRQQLHVTCNIILIHHLLTVSTIVLRSSSGPNTQCTLQENWRIVPYSVSVPQVEKIIQDSPLAHYRVQLKRLVVSYTAVIAGHYLVVFPLLVIYYCRILHYIKKLKRVNGKLAKCTVSMTRILWFHIGT